MAGRTETLTALKGGIDRRKTKGGVAPDRLFDLLDGNVNSAGDAEQRAGTTTVATLPAGTKGLFQHLGKLNVVASTLLTAPANFIVHTIKHPTVPTATLVDIHFAETYLGYPYIAAEWSDASTWHYWLQERAAWAAGTIYSDGDLVFPTVPNGYAYRAKRATPPAPAWAPNVARVVGDRVAPVDGGNYEHVVTAVLGANPRSGVTEPEWAETNGGITYEDTDVTPPPAAAPPVVPPGTTLPPEIGDRYPGLEPGRPRGRQF